MNINNNFKRILPLLSAALFIVFMPKVQAMKSTNRTPKTTVRTATPYVSCGPKSPTGDFPPTSKSSASCTGIIKQSLEKLSATTDSPTPMEPKHQDSQPQLQVATTKDDNDDSETQMATGSISDYLSLVEEKAGLGYRRRLPEKLKKSAYLKMIPPKSLRPMAYRPTDQDFSELLALKKKTESQSNIAEKSTLQSSESPQTSETLEDTFIPPCVPDTTPPTPKSIKNFIGIDKRVFEIMAMPDLIQVPDTALVISIRQETKQELIRDFGPEGYRKVIESQLPLELYRWFHISKCEHAFSERDVVRVCKCGLSRFNILCINQDFLPYLDQMLTISEWKKINCKKYNFLSGFESANKFEGNRTSLNNHVMMYKNMDWIDPLTVTQRFAENVPSISIYANLELHIDFGSYNTGIFYDPHIIALVDCLSYMIYSGINPKSVNFNDPKLLFTKAGIEKLEESSRYNRLASIMFDSFNFSSPTYDITETIRALKFYNIARSIRIFDQIA